MGTQVIAYAAIGIVGYILYRSLYSWYSRDDPPDDEDPTPDDNDLEISRLLIDVKIPEE